MSKQINVKPQTGGFFFLTDIGERMSSRLSTLIPPPPVPISETISLEAHGGEGYHTVAG